MRSTIICVDDEKVLLNILAEQLTTWFGSNYNIEKALGAEDALEILDDCLAQNIDVSVVISDYIMPKMKGDELLEKVKQRNPSIRKIMLTGYSAIDGIISAINKAGLYRYITKPWDNKDLMLTIIEAIKSYEQEQLTSQMSKKFEKLYHSFQKYSGELEETLDSVIEAFSYGVETRDSAIMGHSRRVKQICTLIAKEINMSKEDTKALQYAAFMHDIGKVSEHDDDIGTGCNISSSPAEKRRLIEKSERIIMRIKNHEKLLAAVKYHCENFDGTGVYGLDSNKIPNSARIMRIANDFDLLKNDINSATVLSVDEAAKMIEDGINTKYDPALVKAFLAITKDLKA